tara:strand:- start:1276 stop:1815 length:540 start_codon:yes stop_codon:yes gene_type:complete
MPLYEFECKSCKENLFKALAMIEKKIDKKTLATIIKKFKNINGIQVIDLVSEELIQSLGSREEQDLEIDLYIDEGKKMVLFYVPSFRFSELIFDQEDEKNLETKCCKKGEIERVISSFSYTSDLSTDAPKPPGLKDLPPEIRGRVNFSEMIEPKDQPANIKADNRYKHQYMDKSKTKLL